jgi:hypothetical protein
MQEQLQLPLLLRLRPALLHQQKLAKLPSR